MGVFEKILIMSLKWCLKEDIFMMSHCDKLLMIITHTNFQIKKILYSSETLGYHKNIHWIWKFD